MTPREKFIQRYDAINARADEMLPRSDTDYGRREETSQAVNNRMTALIAFNRLEAMMRDEADEALSR